MSDASKHIKIQNDPMIIHLKRHRGGASREAEIPHSVHEPIAESREKPKAERRGKQYSPFLIFFPICIIGGIALGFYLFGHRSVVAPSTAGTSVASETAGDIVQRVG